MAHHHCSEMSGSIARVAALARADRVAVGLALLEEAALLGPRDHASAGLFLREPGEVARRLAHAAVPADRHRLRQPVVPADLEVERIVAGRDLESARAELAVDALVGDHGDALLGKGTRTSRPIASRYRGSSG